LKDQKECSRIILAKKLKEFVSQGRKKFYLRDIIEEAHVSILDAEDFFIPLLKEDEIEGSLEVRCPNCGAELGIFKRYPEIPEELTCELCGTEFPRSPDYLEIILEIKGKFFRTQKKSFTAYPKKTYQTGNEGTFNRCYQRTRRHNERRKV